MSSFNKIFTKIIKNRIYERLNFKLTSGTSGTQKNMLYFGSHLYIKLNN